MSAVLRRTTTSQGEVVIFDCPGCRAEHAFRVSGPPPSYLWNGSLEYPTMIPSLLYQEVPGRRPRCRSFLKDGKLTFYPDCQHALAGRVVPLPPVTIVPGWWVFPIRVAIAALLALGTLWLVCYILQLQQQAHG